MTKYYIFEYSSSIFAASLNGRGLKKKYKDKELHEAKLCCFQREWNTVWKGKLFLGITYNQPSYVNGVIFEVQKEDIKPYCKSMFVGQCYKFVNVSTNISCNIMFGSQDKIFTCVTRKPASNGQIPAHYLYLIKDGLEVRGKEFTDNFFRTTKQDEYVKHLFFI